MMSEAQVSITHVHYILSSLLYNGRRCFLSLYTVYACKQLFGKHVCPLNMLNPHCVLLSLLTVPPPVFSRPNWPCRSSWPRAWQLASCPTPSPNQLCAQWQLTHWLCATLWAPLPSSRPPSWALHCFGLPLVRCGPHTRQSSSPPTKDVTHPPCELLPCPLYQTPGPTSVWPTWQNVTCKLCSKPDLRWKQCTSPETR